MLQLQHPEKLPMSQTQYPRVRALTKRQIDQIRALVPQGQRKSVRSSLIVREGAKWTK